MLEEIRKYLKPADGTPGEGTESAGVAESKEFDAKSVVICPETPRSKSGMDDLTNFMDVSDGFLKNVFEKYMQQNDPVRVRKETLYNKYVGSKRRSRVISIFVSGLKTRSIASSRCGTFWRSLSRTS